MEIKSKSYEYFFDTYEEAIKGHFEPLFWSFSQPNMTKNVFKTEVSVEENCLSKVWQDPYIQISTKCQPVLWIEESIWTGKTIHLTVKDNICIHASAFGQSEYY